MKRFVLLCLILPSLLLSREMTLEEKVGQVLMVHFRGDEVNEEARKLVQDVHVGAMIIESYNDHGWGLLQVLQRIPPSSTQPVDDFVKAAKLVLVQRVENSPPERNEKQWLKGWFKRTETYIR